MRKSYSLFSRIPELIDEDLAGDNPPSREEYWMPQAILEELLSCRQSEPNPVAGCIIVHNNEAVVNRGSTEVCEPCHPNRMVSNSEAPQWAPCSPSQTCAHWFRQLCDAVLVDAVAAISDKPKLTARISRLTIYRRLVRILFDPFGRVYKVLEAEWRALRETSFSRDARVAGLSPKPNGLPYLDVVNTAQVRKNVLIGLGDLNVQENLGMVNSSPMVAISENKLLPKTRGELINV